MSDKRQIIPIAGLFATLAMAVYMLVQLNGQPAAAGDFSNAMVAEVRDAQGQTILRGQFAVSPDEDDDVERKARLEPTGVDTDAAGEAEVEFARNAPAEQEVEFTVRNLQAGSTVTFLIDGQAIGQAAVNGRGRAELEIEVAGSSQTGAR
jgi:hypothetical protein